MSANGKKIDMLFQALLKKYYTGWDKIALYLEWSSI